MGRSWPVRALTTYRGFEIQELREEPKGPSERTSSSVASIDNRSMKISRSRSSPRQKGKKENSLIGIIIIYSSREEKWILKTVEIVQAPVQSRTHETVVIPIKPASKNLQRASRF